MRTAMEIDWGNPGFLRLYGLVFALSAAFTAAMWLISVVKRAVRGIPVGQAIMENVGYLLMSVVVAGFSPLVVALTVDFVDTAAEEILYDYIAELFIGGAVIFTALATITLLMPGVGVVIAIPIALAILLAVFGLWIMLVVRNALILMGLIFGPIVFSGLVDKDLWGHTKKYVGILGGIIASKLGIYLALALAGALLDGMADSTDRITIPQAIGTSLTFLALLFIALFMPFQISKWIPFVGDELQSMHQVKQEAGQRGRAAHAKGNQKKQNDMAQKASQKQGAGAAGGAAAAGPAAAAVAIKQAADDMRDQTMQAAKDGANNAGGGGGQSSAGSQAPAGGQSSAPGQRPGGGAQGPGGGQGSSRGGSSRGAGSGGQGGGTGRRQGRGGVPSGGARPPAPPPPGSDGGRPPSPPPLSPPSSGGGQMPPPPPSPAPPPPPPPPV